MRVLLAIIVLLAFAHGSAVAQSIVYKCVSTDGVVSFVSERRSGEKCEGAGATTSPRWQHITTSTTGDLVRVDNETITRDGKVVSSWIQYIHLKNRPYIPNRGYAERSMQRTAFDCPRMLYATESYMEYGENSVVLNRGTYLSKAWEPIPPESLLEAVWSYLCINKNPG